MIRLSYRMLYSKLLTALHGYRFSLQPVPDRMLLYSVCGNYFLNIVTNATW